MRVLSVGPHTAGAYRYSEIQFKGHLVSTAEMNTLNNLVSHKKMCQDMFGTATVHVEARCHYGTTREESSKLDENWSVSSGQEQVN